MDNLKLNNDVFINSLVDNYRDTASEELKIQILNEFDPYFTKYANLLCSSSPVDLNNKDTLKFLRLFMSEEERATDTNVINAARRLIGYLRSLFRDCTKQDIYDEMIGFFLEQLCRYKPMIANNTPAKERISFTHFVQVNIRYRIKCLAKTRSRDALHCVHNVEYKDEINGTGKLSHVCVNWSDIDMRWVRGSSAGDIFSQLDDAERYLLYLKYESGRKPLSDYSVAKITGMDRMYVRRKMLKIVEKVKTLAEDSFKGTE